MRQMPETEIEVQSLLKEGNVLMQKLETGEHVYVRWNDKLGLISYNDISGKWQKEEQLQFIDFIGSLTSRRNQWEN